MKRKAVILCIDGCGPDYYHLSPLPFLKRVARDGSYVEVNSMIPSVTNVNAVSILTGKYPEEHGITTNFYFNRGTGQEVFMESPDFIKTSTLLERAKSGGVKTALLTSKEKLRTLLNRGADVSFSAERPPLWITKEIGPPPPIYSIEVDIWLIKALQKLLLKEDLDLTYVMTTDYVMHTYGPETKESQSHMNGMDGILEETLHILESGDNEVLLCVCADHGMSEKDKAINLEIILRERGISTKMNTIIADRYIVHHRNLGGAAYIYLEDSKDAPQCLQALEDIEGLESVLPMKQACKRYHLDEERIGDFLVLGNKNVVFGLIDEKIADVSIRSHGSLYERKVPLITSLPDIKDELTENKDICKVITTWVSI